MVQKGPNMAPTWTQLFNITGHSSVGLSQDLSKISKHFKQVEQRYSGNRQNLALLWPHMVLLIGSS